MRGHYRSIKRSAAREVFIPTKEATAVNFNVILYCTSTYVRSCIPFIFFFHRSSLRLKTSAQLHLHPRRCNDGNGKVSILFGVTVASFKHDRNLPVWELSHIAVRHPILPYTIMTSHTYTHVHTHTHTHTPPPTHTHTHTHTVSIRVSAHVQPGSTCGRLLNTKRGAFPTPCWHVRRR